MGSKSKFRGYDIESIDGVEWLFCDNGKTVRKTWEERPCGHCLKETAKSGHDTCLGAIPGVINACCGHGNANEAYVQLAYGVAVYGESAKILCEELKEGQSC
jgi:hypothetical protein